MTGEEPLELERPRDLGELLSTSLRVYRSNFGKLFALGLAVSLAVNGIVLGVGLEELWSGYDESPSNGQTLVVLATSLITNPLIIAMTIAVLRGVEKGDPPSAGGAIQRGLDVFTPILLVVVLAAGGVALGLLLFVVPGIYLAIRWYFAVQAVVIEDLRGTDALTRSADLVRGSWWRVFGIVLVAVLVSAIPAAFLGLPLAVAAEAADRAVVALAGQILAEALVAPFNALLVTLLFYDLRARARTALTPDAVSGPPDPPGLPPSS